MKRNSLSTLTRLMGSLGILFPTIFLNPVSGEGLVFGQESSAPELMALSPTQGRAGTVVVIKGKNLGDAEIHWGVAGKSLDQLLPGSYGGAQMFSVPAEAAEGTYHVVVKNRSGSSEPLPFQVTESGKSLESRIDFVTLLKGTTFDGQGNVTPNLYVQGANIDVGAKVIVNGHLVEAMAHKVLRNDLDGLDPSILGYPIYHYLSLVVKPGIFPTGSELAIAVHNPNTTEEGDVFTYRLPANAECIDSDGDGLWDTWETKGYDANGDGVLDVDLPGLGADPYRRDLIVEIGVMSNLLHSPKTEDFEMAKEVFLEAPILNPYRSKGINLSIQQSNLNVSWQEISFELPQVRVGNRNIRANFYDLKAKYFKGAVRGKIYHYGIWALNGTGGESGNGNLDGFVITLDRFCETRLNKLDCDKYHTARVHAATLIHELGHNLNQRHGGDSDTEFKPNHWSVMSYSWQLRSAWPDWYRKKIPTCEALKDFIDFSEGMGPELNVDALPPEKNGICGQPVDWDGDKIITSFPIRAGLQCPKEYWNEDCTINGRENDFANWRNLNFLEALK